ncbi:hypothetical protein [Burkholderia vietnamiensis]|uniref:hypothetical protein n=1 Tax=Burkholderia vietnamiensis TaxID=60552 RepID=UPI001B96E09A|nr:hypothetical protein [Burkholderia vietnamiensis]MBR8219368.1 hypothetical protein [Burkholderia vietnamiensis]
MKSLRRRLLLWLVPATLLIGVIASATTYWGALTEIDELLSDQLKAVARHVNVDANGRLSLTGVRQSDDTSLSGQLRISANVTADFGNVTDSAGLGVAQCRL